MLQNVAAVLVVAALSLAGKAEPPVAPKSVDAQVGGIAEVVVRAADGKKLGYQAGFGPDRALFTEVVSKVPGESKFWLSPKAAGPLVVTWWNVGEDSGSVTVVNGGSDPAPQPPAPQPPAPQPNPNPRPNPKPVGPVKVKAVIVEETADLAAARSRFVGDAKIQERWKANGHPGFTVLDKDTKDGATNATPAAAKPYIDRAKGKGLPQLYLMNAQTGDLLYEGPAFDDPAVFLAVVEKIGG